MKEYHSSEYKEGILSVEYLLDGAKISLGFNGGVLMSIVDFEYDTDMIRIVHVKHLANFKFKIIGVTTDCDTYRLDDSTTVGYEIDLQHRLIEDLSYL